MRLVDSTTGYFSQQIPAAAQVDIQPFSLKLDNTSLSRRWRRRICCRRCWIW
ncbi:hypothetical protein M8494_21650 [Serratia ureilytica]